MGELPKGDFSVASTHHSMLKTVLGRLLYTNNPTAAVFMTFLDN